MDIKDMDNEELLRKALTHEWNGGINEDETPNPYAPTILAALKAADELAEALEVVETIFEKMKADGELSEQGIEILNRIIKPTLSKYKEAVEE